VRSTQELQVDETLAVVGLKVMVSPARTAEDKGGARKQAEETPESDGHPRAWLGASLKEKGGGMEVASVLEGSPAQAAGVAAGDEIAAIDGFRADLKQRLGRAQPGQSLRLSLFRMDELLEVPVQLAAGPRDTVTLVPDVKATPEQVLAREKWLGARWPEE